MSFDRQYKLKDTKLEDHLQSLTQYSNKACVPFDVALKLACEKLPYPFTTDQLIDVEFGPMNYSDMQTRKYMYVVRFEPNMIDVTSSFVYGQWNNIRHINIDTIPENIDLLVHCQRPTNGNIQSPMWIFGARFNKATHELIIYNSLYQTHQNIQGLLDHYKDVCVSIYKDVPSEKTTTFSSMMVDNKDELTYSTIVKTPEE